MGFRLGGSFSKASVFNLTQVLLKLEKVRKGFNAVEAELNLGLMKISASICGAQRILQMSRDPIPFHY